MNRLMVIRWDINWTGIVRYDLWFAKCFMEADFYCFNLQLNDIQI